MNNADLDHLRLLILNVDLGLGYGWVSCGFRVSARIHRFNRWLKASSRDNVWGFNLSWIFVKLRLLIWLILDTMGYGVVFFFAEGLEWSSYCLWGDWTLFGFVWRKGLSLRLVLQTLRIMLIGYFLGKFCGKEVFGFKLKCWMWSILSCWCT